MKELPEHEPFDDGEELFDEEKSWWHYRWEETIRAIDSDIAWQERELKRIGGNIDDTGGL